MDSLAEHLKMIQRVIERMSRTQMLLRGWSLSAVVAAGVLDVGDLDARYLIASLSAVVLFWCLDGYYLRQERLFRSLYDYVRTSETGDTDYSMDTRPYSSQARNKWHCCLRSVVLMIFYPALAAVVLAIFFTAKG